MSVATQWISGITVRVSDADNRSIIPMSYLVQQTHQARVRNQCANFWFVNRQNARHETDLSELLKMLERYIGAMHTAFLEPLKLCKVLTWWSLGPKRIEVKPVVRRMAREMLQALGVALHPQLDLLRPTIAIQCDLVGKMFEVNFVTLPAPVETEEQNNGTMRRGGKHDWPDRKRGWPAKEFTLGCLTIARYAVAQSPDEEPRI